MYRFTTRLSNSHLVLVRKKLSDGSCAALIVMRAPTRQYAKDFYQEKCPDAPPLKKSKKLLYGTIGFTLMAAGSIAYAKNSKKTRDWLEANAPFANNFIALVYQENNTYGNWVYDKGVKIKQFVVDFLFGKEGISPMEFEQQSEQDLEADAAKGFAPRVYPLPPPILEMLYKEQPVPGQPEVMLDATLVQTDKCPAVPEPEIHITKDVLKYEQDMHKYTRAAVDNYKKATAVTKDFNRTLHAILEQPPGQTALFSSLKAQYKIRDDALQIAKESTAKARCALDNMERVIKDSKLAAPPEEMAATKRFLKQFRQDIVDAEKACEKEVNDSVVTEKYWEKVEAARAMYRSELETIFPNINLCGKDLSDKGPVEVLLVYFMNQVEYLQRALAELQTVQELKLNKAIECHEEAALIKAKAEDMVKKEIIQKELEFLKKAMTVQREADKKMQAELAKQFEIQDAITHKLMEKKEAEIMAAANRRASEEIEKERVKFKKELAAMVGRMQAIELTLKKRATAEAEARRSQSIWTAAEALLSALRKPVPYAKIENEIKALEKAGKTDKLVCTIVKGIPQEAREKGVATEKALKDKFDVLEDTAAKVALIGRTGGTLPMYFISWLQSKVMFQKFSDIPQVELDNLPVDFTQLDTFDIIQRARYYMDQGDLCTAMRYVNLLQGAPRAAATCWLQAARAHLELRQAAQTIMAHASLASMLQP